MLLPNCSHLLWESPIRPLASRPHVPSTSRGMALPMAMKTMKVSGILGSFVFSGCHRSRDRFSCNMISGCIQIGVWSNSHRHPNCLSIRIKQTQEIGWSFLQLLCFVPLFYTCVGKGISAEILKAPWDISFWVEYYVRNVSMWYGNSKWPAGHSTIEKGSLNHPQGHKELHQ